MQLAIPLMDNSTLVKSSWAVTPQSAPPSPLLSPGYELQLHDLLIRAKLLMTATSDWIIAPAELTFEMKSRQLLLNLSQDVMAALHTFAP